MSRKTGRWFLPDTPDVLGLLQRQADVTAQGIASFAEWAGGDVQAGDAVRDAEHEADTCKYELIATVREAFTTPLDPEDLFELSRGLDEVMNGAKNTVREAEALQVATNGQMAEMVELIAEGVGFLRVAFYAIGEDETAANQAAADAVKTQRRLERAYRRAMAQLIDEEDMRRVIGVQELYRRITKISEEILAVADRVGYATVKES